MAEQVKGAFTVRFLKIGDDVYITREIYRIDNGVRKGAALFQAVDIVSGALSVDWTDPNQQPICEFSAKSAVGYPVSIIEATFAYDGSQIVFSSADGTGWRTSTDNKFKMMQSDGKVFFKIVDNIASPTQVANKQIGYSLTYISNGMINSYVGSMDIVIQQAGSDSHYAVIITPRIVLDAINTSTTLTLQASYGVKNITIGEDGYTVEWYKDKVKMPDTTASITVTRDDVSGASMYVAILLLNGVPVAQDGQHISDVADEYQVRVHRIVDFVSQTTNGQFEFYLMKNNVTLPTLDTDWTWDIYNALGVVTKSGTGKSVTVTAADCKNTPIGGGPEYYSDANYVGTVTII
jgi:hypothetical protein